MYIEQPKLITDSDQFYLSKLYLRGRITRIGFIKFVSLPIVTFEKKYTLNNFTQRIMDAGPLHMFANLQQLVHFKKQHIKFLNHLCTFNFVITGQTQV